MSNKRVGNNMAVSDDSSGMLVMLSDASSSGFALGLGPNRVAVAGLRRGSSNGSALIASLRVRRKGVGTGVFIVGRNASARILVTGNSIGKVNSTGNVTKLSTGNCIPLTRLNGLSAAITRMMSTLPAAGVGGRVCLVGSTDNIARGGCRRCVCVNSADTACSTSG